MKALVISLLILMFVPGLFAQPRKITPEVIRKFKDTHPGVDVDALLQFIDREKRKWVRRHQAALKRAKQLGLPIRFRSRDGRIAELQYFEGRMPVYYIAFNLNAARTISTDKAWEVPYNLSGTGINIGQWDEGKIYTDHEEFLNSIIEWSDDSTNVNISDHSTEVAGTMIAEGKNSDAHGMAPSAQVHAYDWKNDISEMGHENFFSNISNHSYGKTTGWTFIENHPLYGNVWAWAGNVNVDSYEDYKFGFYTPDSKAIDSLTYLNPYFLPVIAAGNDRDEYPGAAIGHLHLDDGDFHDDVHSPDGNNGYDCLPGGYQTAKNPLVVGAIHDIPDGHQNPDDIMMSSFSSWGPTDDGRIKPDIVANGTELITTGILDSVDYDTVSGTSFAAPSVTGSMALILEYFKQYGYLSIYGSTLKALVIHSADDAGNPGPDYVYGWGLMNTLEALKIIDQEISDSTGSHIKEIDYSEPTDLYIQSDGFSGYIKVTVCWFDPGHDTLQATLDPITPMLVNDIDIELESSNNQRFYPYILDPSNPNSSAVQGVNSIDNVEQIFAESLESNFTLHITHKGAIKYGHQKLSIIVTGGKFVPEPPKDYIVHVDQQLSSTASVGTVKFWNYNSNDWSSPVSVPYDKPVPENDPYVSVHASTNIIKDEKFNYWVPDNVHFIWDTWMISGDKDLISQFKPVGSAVFKKPVFVATNESIESSLEFKDPWFIDRQDSSYFYTNQNDPHANKPKGFRNKGMENAPFYSLTLPATIKLTEPRQGVFLNQNPQFQQGKPIYSVRASQYQRLPFRSDSVSAYFLQWEGHSDSVSFQYPTQRETGVVFKLPGATVRATYDAALLVEDTDALQHNNQSKLAYVNGSFHLVYEENGNIYYTRSSDNGYSWSREEKVNAVNGNCSSPAVAVNSDGSLIAVVWEQYNEVHIRIRSASGWKSDVLLEHFTITSNPGFLATPVVSYGMNTFQVVWRIKNSLWGDGLRLVAFDGVANSAGTAITVPNTNGNSRYPTLAFNGQNTFYLAWEENGTIYYSEFRYDDSGFLDCEDPQTCQSGDYCFGVCKEDASSGSGYSGAGYPSIAVNSAREAQLAWQAHSVAMEVDVVVHARRSSSGTWSYNSFVDSHAEADYRRPVLRGFPMHGFNSNNALRLVWWEWPSNSIYIGKYNGSSWSVQKPGWVGYTPTISENWGTDNSVRLVYRKYTSTPYLLKDTDAVVSLSQAAGSNLAVGMTKGYRYRLEPGGIPLVVEISQVESAGQAVRAEAVHRRDATGTCVLQSSFSARDSRVVNYWLVVESPQWEQLAKAGYTAGDLQLVVDAVDARDGHLLGRLQTVDLLAGWRDVKDTLQVRIPAYSVPYRVEWRLTTTGEPVAVGEPVVVNYLGGVSTVTEGDKPLAEQLKGGSRSLPQTYVLEPAYPNPFNPSTTIGYALPEASEVALEVYNVQGQRIRELVGGRQPAGWHAVVWDGRNSNGKPVPSGVYVVRMTAHPVSGTGNTFVASRKVVLMK